MSHRETGVALRGCGGLTPCTPPLVGQGGIPEALTEETLSLLAEFNFLNPSTSFLELSSSACVSASLFGHYIPPSFSVRRFHAGAAFDCVPASFIFIQPGSFRVLTNSACALWVSDCVLIDFCLKYASSSLAPSISGTSSISWARLAVELKVSSSEPE